MHSDIRVATKEVVDKLPAIQQSSAQAFSTLFLQLTVNDLGICLPITGSTPVTHTHTTTHTATQTATHHTTHTATHTLKKSQREVSPSHYTTAAELEHFLAAVTHELEACTRARAH